MESLLTPVLEGSLWKPIASSLGELFLEEKLQDAFGVGVQTVELLGLGSPAPGWLCDLG